MTREEATAVAGICLSADGGCYHCARELIDALKKRFPDHAVAMQTVYDAEYE